MQSFLIISKDPETSEEYALTLCKQHNIDPFDIAIIEQQEESIGIAEIRTLQKSLFLKPFKSKTKAAILKNAQNLTVAAQNALLKVLEEPPNNTLIILTVTQKDLLLPTILSRCTIIGLEDKAYELSKKETTEYVEVLSSLLSDGVGEKLKRAQDLSKNKDEAVVWLENMIIVSRQKLLEDILNNNNETIEQFNNVIVSFQKTLIILKTTNVAPRFALENLFLLLS